MDNCVAIITARGGSKRIPRKNIKEFVGKPIIQYSLQAAMAADIFEEIMVSTDDDEIAAVAKKAGAIVPFKRSLEAADDFATTAQVLTEVLLSYQKAGKHFKYACCIYPTAPFVTAKKLADAFDLLKNSDADAVLPITKFSFPIWRSFKLNDTGKVAYNWPEYAPKRSQDLPPAFHDCGQFYFFHVATFLQTGKLVTENTIGLEVPESEVQDIDTIEDWKIAEIKYDLFIRDGK